MKLETSDFILHYFPGGIDHQSSPRQYAIQARQDEDLVPLDKIPLTNSDRLEIKMPSSELVLNDVSLGQLAESQTKEDVEGFIREWQKGTDIIKTLKQALIQQKSAFLQDKKINVRIVTWNLHGDPIYEADDEPFHFLVGSSNADEKAKSDLIILCFQETIPLNAKNLSSSPERVSAWQKKLSSYLPADYTTVTTNRLLGLTVIAFASIELAEQISSINTNTIGTGLLGLWANKGAIEVDFKLGADETAEIEGTSFQLFNCHLASGHGREMLDHRRRELYDIQRKFEILGNGQLVNENWTGVYDDTKYKDYLYYDEMDEMDKLAKDMDISDGKSGTDEHDDYSDDDNEMDDDNNDDTKDTGETEDLNDAAPNGITFCCGDLNYRIFMERNHIEQCLSEGELAPLIELDGLSQERAMRKVFENFEEGPLKFNPTYKYSTRDKYDFNRIPSYCDRVLYTPHKFLSQTQYAAIPEMSKSDHKPVVAEFELQFTAIDHDKRTSIVTEFFKEQDRAENDSRPVVEISKQDLEPASVHYMIPTTLETVLKNNDQSVPLEWEIVLLLDDSKPSNIVSIEPMSGTLNPGKEQTLRISGVLPFGIKEFHNTSILRVHNSRDFFISYTFQIYPSSVFGKSLMQLSNADAGKRAAGIPKEIYQFVNYLSEHNYHEMFEEIDFQHLDALDTKLIEDLDEGKGLDLEYLETQKLIIECIKSIAKVLMMLLENLPDGIVSIEFTVQLINHIADSSKKKKKEALSNEEIILYVLELVPNPEANCLMFMVNFLKLLIKDYKFDAKKLTARFQNILFKIPAKLSKRKMMTDSKLRNLKKRRTELVYRLLIED